jgi:hypothetical protein
MTALITLLTDFGTSDGYVGEVKGVLESALRDVKVIDVAHDVRRHDTNGARLTLARYWRRFPHGTVHMAIVDPGVGSERAALAVESAGYFLVGPDSGILSPALYQPDARAVQLAVPAGSSVTFHGRDVFAPAAAALAAGEPIESLGAPCEAPVILRTPEPQRTASGGLAGEIIHIDAFGNALTNLIAPGGGVVAVRDMRFAVGRTYSDVAVGEGIALTGSSGLIEIAVREGSAAGVFGLRCGDRVTLSDIAQSAR